MTDLVFLKTLREKLKGGNARSIHLNVLPGRFATRLDLSHLNYIEPGFAEKFLNQLLTKNCFEYKISFDGIDLNSIKAEEQKRIGLLSKRLNSINIENDDNYKEHGIKTFGFGFPILIKPSKIDPHKIIKAPLFIWQLEIYKATNKVNTWSILRNKTRNETGKIFDEEIHSFGLNEVLLSFLKTDEGISLPQINEDILEDGIFDQEELVEECQKILKSLNANISTNFKESLFSKFTESLKNIPEAPTLDSESGNLPWIYFGGVFGLFRTQKESIITDIDKIIDKFDDFDFENLKFDNFSGTPHSAIETDPSQQEILTTLGTNPKKIIQGPPGTGKSQSLTALITNALANNLKCLVVCEKKTALDVIKNNLNKESIQLGALAAVVEDINKDRDRIVSSVRDRLGGSLTKYASFNETNYTIALATVEENAAELNLQHSQLAEEIYLGKTWTDLVGKFMKGQKFADFEALQPKLDHKQFKFQEDKNELYEIIAKIKSANKLYKNIDSLNHPLEILNDAIFMGDSHIEIQQQLKNISEEITKQFFELELQLQKEISEYKNWLDTHFGNYYFNVMQEIKNYRKFVDSNYEQFGESFFKNSSFAKFKIKSLSIVSKYYKGLKANRITLVKNVLNIKRIHQTLKYFDHNYIDNNAVSSLKIFDENINKLKEELEEWFRKNEKVKQDFLQNFSSNCLHPLFTNNSHLKTTERKFEQITSKHSQERVLRRCLTDKKNHNLKIVEIDILLAEMKTILVNLENFREYYDWRKFYIELNPLHRKVVTSIIEVNCKNWETTFENWYYYWLLAIAESNLKRLPKNEDTILEMAKSKEQLKKFQLQSIVSNWSNKQMLSEYRLKQTYGAVRTLYNLRGAPGQKRNSLRKIINKDFKFFTDFFPVLMLSPSTCSSIIPLIEGLFDIVIFDEASQLRLEDTYPALIRGKIKVVSGDSQQMPPSNFFQGGSALLNPTEDDDDSEEEFGNEVRGSNRNRNNSFDLANSESLLSYAENSNYTASYLNVHYRSQHPYLIDFSNYAFYGKRLIPMPEKQVYKPIQFIEVNGIYEDQLNKDEARQVIDILLNHIKPFKDGKYPTVGIATFNIYQRNLILEEIAKTRHQKPEYEKKLADLGNDLFVKNLENIQGDERDIIILSTTFGKKPSGNFGQNFGPISNKTKGYKLLNVIVTRAKFKIFICTSIPNTAIQQYSELIKKEFAGNGVFYSYLAYAKAISDNNFEIAKQILDEVYDSSPHKSFSVEGIDLGSESPFEEEVYERLAEKIGKDRLQQQYPIGGFRIDIVVKSKKTGKPILAIECDGAKYHSSTEAFAWDSFRQSRLEDQGFIFYRIWSTNWWYSSDKELKNLISFILRFDGEENVEGILPLDEMLENNEIVPITSRPENLRKVSIASKVTLKNPEGETLKVKFSRIQGTQNGKHNSSGMITIYEKSPLALAIMNKSEGELCQLGLLEIYYEILKVE